MSNQLLIDIGLYGTRAARLQAGTLTDIRIYPKNLPPEPGRIYLGRIAGIDKSLDAAFVDLGGDQTGFLKKSDIPASLRDTLHEGQKLPVQLISLPQKGKESRLSAFIRLESPYLVFKPGGKGLTLSKKIGDKADQTRLTEDLGPFITEGHLTIRTDAVNISSDRLEQEAADLQSRWQDLRADIERDRKPRALSSLVPPFLSAIDTLCQPGDKVIVNQATAYRTLQKARQDLSLELHTALEPLFDREAIEEQIEEALEKEVTLPSGGWLTVERTEALIAIDVNSGSDTRMQDREEQARAVNEEAAMAAARKIRLRNLSGIILIDFISMNRKGAAQELKQLLEKATRSDPNPVRVIGMTELGLMQMTRQRKQAALQELLDYPALPDKGATPSFSLASRILRDLARYRADHKQSTLVLAHGEGLAPFLKAEYQTIAAFLGIILSLRQELAFAPEAYRIESSKDTARDLV